MSVKNEAPSKIKFELVREVAGETDPVVIKTKRIMKTDEIVLFPKMKPMPRAYFVTAIIKRQYETKRFLLFLIPWGMKTVTEYIVRCNAYWSESLETLTEKIPKFSQELENLKLSDDMKQHIDGVAAAQKFQLDSTMLKLMLIVFAMSIPFGIFMNVILHLVPSQIVIWSP